MFVFRFSSVRFFFSLFLCFFEANHAVIRGAQAGLKDNNLFLSSVAILSFSVTLNPIENGVGGGAKRPPTSFSPVTSTNVKISPQIFLTFSFNHFATLMKNFKAIPSARLLNLNQKHPSKNLFFWSHPYKIEIMIISLIEMLELPSFDYMTTPTI